MILDPRSGEGVINGSASVVATTLWIIRRDARPLWQQTTAILGHPTLFENTLLSGHTQYIHAPRSERRLSLLRERLSRIQHKMHPFSFQTPDHRIQRAGRRVVAHPVRHRKAINPKPFCGVALTSFPVTRRLDPREAGKSHCFSTYKHNSVVMRRRVGGHSAVGLRPCTLRIC